MQPRSAPLGKTRIGRWILDAGNLSLVSDSSTRHLRAKVAAVLRILCARAGETVTRGELIDDVWSGNHFVGHRGLTNAVWQLRQHLGENAIVTVAKVGYRLELPVTKAQPFPQRMTNRSRYALYALPIGLVLITLFVFAGVQWPRARNPEYDQSTLTYYSGVEEYPAFSGNGDYLAFSWEQSDRGIRLFVRDLRSEDASLRQVSIGNDDEVAPAWGPSDQELAFARIARDGSCRIIIRSLLSVAERYVDVCAYERHHRILDWSRDGRHIFYARPGPEAGVVSIYRHDVITGQSQRITHPRAGQEDKQLAASPDSRGIAFVRTSGATADVFVVSNNGDLRQVTSDHNPVYGVTWLDADTLVLNVLRNGKFGLWQLKVESGEMHLMHSAEMPFNLSAVPGEPGALAFSLHRGMEYLAMMPFGAADGNETGLQSTGRDMYAVYSSAATRLLFLSTRSGNAEVWSAAPDGSKPRQHTRNQGLPDLPVWAPDGGGFAVPFFNGGHYQVHLFDTMTGKSRQVTDDEYDYRNLNWFGAENALLASSNRNGAWDLWRVPLDGGSFVQITDDGGQYGQIHDGYLYYVRADEAGLWRKPLKEDGPTERISVDLHRNDWGNWQKSDEGLFYVSREADADEVRRFDPSTGKTETVAGFARNSIRIYRSFALAGPDRMVLTRLGNRQADIVLLRPRK